jgi:bacteriocin-like protein
MKKQDEKKKPEAVRPFGMNHLRPLSEEELKKVIGGPISTLLSWAGSIHRDS